jgi:hypothetical protein
MRRNAQVPNHYVDGNRSAGVTETAILGLAFRLDWLIDIRRDVAWRNRTEDCLM